MVTDFSVRNEKHDNIEIETENSRKADSNKSLYLLEPHCTILKQLPFPGNWTSIDPCQVRWRSYTDSHANKVQI